MNFQKYPEWNYNNYFEILDWRWFEMKFLEKYASGMALNTFSIALGFLHSIACFWSCEEGLWRCHPESQISIFVFQYLHSQRDNGVSTKITRSIRLHLSKDKPKNEKDAYKYTVVLQLLGDSYSS